MLYHLHKAQTATHARHVRCCLLSGTMCDQHCYEAGLRFTDWSVTCCVHLAKWLLCQLYRPVPRSAGTRHVSWYAEDGSQQA